MSAALVEVSEFTTSVVVPEDGDPRDAASVEVPFQALTNRALFLRNHTPGAAEFYELDVPLGPASDPTTFAFQNGPFGLSQSSTSTPFHFVQLALPYDLSGGWAAKIAEIKAYFLPAGGHGGLPASQPEITLWRQPRTGSGSGVSVQAQQLAAGSVGAYETAQTITMVLGGSGHTILNDHVYWVSFEGESGANSATGLLLTRLTMMIAEG